MYKNVIFDLYGTLVDISTDESKDELWRIAAGFYSFNGAVYTPYELKSAYHKYVKALYASSDAKHPDIDLAIVFEKLYTDKDIIPTQECVRLTAQTFRILSTEYLRVYDGVHELIDSLHESGFKIYLLTNAQRLFTVPELECLDLYDRFDGMVISSDVKCCKPDKAIFDALLNEYSLKAGDCVMVGNDASSDILGAHDSGMDSIYVKSNLSPDDEPSFAKYRTDIAHIKDILKFITD